MEHSGFTLWLTGPPGAGKTTLAGVVAAVLRARGMKVEVLDGEAVRQHFGAEPGPAQADQATTIRCLAFICQLLARNGVVAIATDALPDRAPRDAVRPLLAGHLVEVYCHASPDALARRNAKLPSQGLARAGAPYAPPARPDVRVDSGTERPEQSAAKILKKLHALGYLPRAPHADTESDAEDDETVLAERLHALGYI